MHSKSIIVFMAMATVMAMACKDAFPPPSGCDGLACLAVAGGNRQYGGLGFGFGYSLANVTATRWQAAC